MKFYLTCLITILFSTNNFAQQKIDVYASLQLKKSFVYDGILENTNNQYRLFTKINPMLSITVDKTLFNNFGISIGSAITYNNLILSWNYGSSYFNGKEKLKLKIFSIKLPINLNYKLINNMSIYLGASPNYYTYSSYKTSGETSGDSIILNYDLYTPFINKFTLSSQVGLNYSFSKKSSANFHLDCDWGCYPFIESRINFEDMRTNHKELFHFKGNPKLIYLSIGYSYLIW